MSPPAPVLAIIIATKDHPAELQRLLQSLREQSVRPHQVIIVDGGHQPVERVVPDFPDLHLCYGRVCPPGLAKQQNAGLAWVEPSITLIGYLDDDIVLDTSALEAMCRFWQQAPPDVAGAGFNIINNSAPQRGIWLKSLFGMDSPRRGVMLPSGYQTRIGRVAHTIDVEWLNSGTTVWRRPVLETVRFDEWFSGPSHLHDVDMSYTISRRYRLTVVADACVQEIPDPNRRWDDVALGRWQVLNRLYLVSKHPELSRLKCGWALIGQLVVNVIRSVVDRRWAYYDRAKGNMQGWLAVPGLLRQNYAQNRCAPGRLHHWFSKLHEDS